MDLPSYDELPVQDDKPPKSSWGLWGEDDQLGAMNLLTEEQAQRGLRCASRGKVFPLNWKLELPDPPLYGRETMKHTIFPILDFAMDDYYDNFYPQGSSQWDALNHVSYPKYGYYNGRTTKDFTGEEGNKNGVEHLARRGIVSRGVLLDMPRYLATQGREVDGGETVEFSVENLEGAREAAGITYEVGDILLVRTGWLAWYENASQEQRQALAADSMNKLKTPGLAAGEDVARYMWDAHFAGVAADNPAFEAWPHPLELDKYLHYRLLPLLGIAIGEMWYLEQLAEDCAQDGVYEFLLTSAPLNKLGGMGSPPNALAIK